MLDAPVSPRASDGGKSRGVINRAPTPKPASSSTKSGGKKNSKVKERTLEDVERDIEKAEGRVKEIEAALGEAALHADAALLTQYTVEYEQAKAQVDELLVEWERMAEAVG